jgi:hypothetical protein
MRIRYIFILILVFSFTAMIDGQMITQLLPENPAGWKTSLDDRIYTPESLYDYIDGGAELYLSFNMIEVASRIIAMDEAEIRIEIFDMSSSSDAFGVFSHTRTRDEKQYGQGSQYFTGALIFWKANYYIAITANDENDEIIQAMQSLAKQIEQKIGQTGELPGITKLLPPENLLEDGFIYFHHYIWLNSYYYISNENLLNIDNHTSALMAKYGDRENRYYLLLVEYPGESEAGEAYKNLLTELFDNRQEVIRLEDEGWIGARINGRYLTAVFDAPSAENVNKLLDLCTERIKNQQ